MVVENALATYSPECVLQIKQANQIIDSQIKTRKGAKIIEKKFKYIIYNIQYTFTQFNTLLKLEFYCYFSDYAIH